MSAPRVPGMGPAYRAARKAAELEECEEIEVHMTLRGELARRFDREAQRRTMSHPELMAMLIENVITDNLFAAVIDNE